MKHQSESHYPAPAAVVLKMFADRSFHERKLQKLGIANFEIIEHEADGERARIRISRQLPVQLPGMKKGAGAVVHTEVWNLKDGVGDITAEPQGMPLEMRCSARIEPDGDDACVARYEWDIKANVPVVGKRIEKFVAADIDKRGEQEAEAGRTLLDDYR
ncbi:DUF2505 domain-containing protein [Algiphilus sp.]|uniref:DUF2505 domain-containing protein n=1 Tax=Algiphilus sp. TaxID=1872431 RepID=UPI0025BA362F|nr:DUF2505 domain-containing protein [Algiphilus sp.]MCI5104457.1 DUF2505 domain-containing protein [Algiphilus sp.]MCR9091898.1 DUF2505 domain-containing protein [Pseudomonadota bacterium]